MTQEVADAQIFRAAVILLLAFIALCVVRNGVRIDGIANAPACECVAAQEAGQ